MADERLPPATEPPPTPPLPDGTQPWTGTPPVTDGQAVPPPADAITAANVAYRALLGASHAKRLTAAVAAAAPALRAQDAATERERWRAVLAEHYLMTVECDHASKLDNPICGCCRVFLGWHPSVGAAVQAWIDHVADLIRARTTP